MATKPSEADIIIVGAGTAGLALAEKLSRNSSIKIYIFEAGKDFTGHEDTQNVYSYPKNMGTERDWQFETVPQNKLDSDATTQHSGKLLGGSSCINGGYYTAPSRAGVTAWNKLGNSNWNYDLIRNSCLETICAHAPDGALCSSMGVECNAGKFAQQSNNGPVRVAPEFYEHPVTKAYIQTLKGFGYAATSDIFTDHSAVGQSLYLTQDPTHKTRSAADSAFGSPLKTRPNITITTNATVTKVILEGSAPSVRAKGIQVILEDKQAPVTFLASKEVILCGGTYNTPKLLELSGIGQSDILKKFQVPQIIDSPNVGERLRNHVLAAVHCELAQEVPPSIALTFMGYMASKDQAGLVKALKEYQPQQTDDKTYDAAVKDIFLDPNEGSCYHFIASVGVPNALSLGVIQAIPFSKGSTHITSSDFYTPPDIDPAFYSHPLDLEIISRHLTTAAGFASQPAMKPFFKMNANGVSPAAAEAVGDLNAAKEYVRKTTRTTYHACGTASMRPQSDGGVVNQELKVYGTQNLRVVDASVIPLIPHGNPMAVVYAIASHAAEIISAEVVRE